MDADEEEWDRIMQVNVKSMMLTSKYAIPHMVAAGGGAIVNISSIMGLVGNANTSAYTATKHGVVGLTKTAALELAGHGIRVNCVIPGVSETAQPLEDTTLDELLERGKRIPLGRIGQPDDIAAVVSFLLSSDAGYMTGQSVACNGGSIMVP